MSLPFLSLRGVHQFTSVYCAFTVCGTYRSCTNFLLLQLRLARLKIWCQLANGQIRLLLRCGMFSLRWRHRVGTRWRIYHLHSSHGGLPNPRCPISHLRLSSYWKFGGGSTTLSFACFGLRWCHLTFACRKHKGKQRVQTWLAMCASRFLWSRKHSKVKFSSTYYSGRRTSLKGKRINKENVTKSKVITQEFEMFSVAKQHMLRRRTTWQTRQLEQRTLLLALVFDAPDDFTTRRRFASGPNSRSCLHVRTHRPQPLQRYSRADMTVNVSPCRAPDMSEGLCCLRIVFFPWFEMWYVDFSKVHQPYWIKHADLPPFYIREKVW